MKLSSFRGSRRQWLDPAGCECLEHDVAMRDLWYFSFVQIPTMPAIPAELKGGVTGYIAPKALV